MWILSFLPNWIFHAILATGIITVIASTFLGFLPFIRTYAIPAKIIGYILVALGLFLEGGLLNNAAWEARVREMEEKVAKAEVESAKENVKIVEKIVRKTEYITRRGNDIVTYVDREIVKYDTKFAPGGICEIPKEFIKAHNDAADQPK